MAEDLAEYYPYVICMESMLLEFLLFGRIDQVETPVLLALCPQATNKNDVLVTSLLAYVVLLHSFSPDKLLLVLDDYRF